MHLGSHVLPLCLFWLAGCAAFDREAWLVLGDVGAGAGASRLKELTPVPSRTPVSYTVSGRPGTGDLYLPGTGKAEAGIVLVPGAVPDGKDDERLVALATTLARARFAVLTPDLSGYRDLKVRPAHVREVADAFRYLVSRDALAPQGRAGIGAISYAVGPAILAAMQEDIREQVRFVLGVGGYCDLRVAIRFLTTGYFEDEGAPRYLRPSDYGRLVFARTAVDYLSRAADRSALDAMVEAKLEDAEADVSGLAERLSAEGLAVYRLLVNSDARETARLIADLPQPLIDAIQALTLQGKDLSGLSARLILVHGMNDPLIPYTESLALKRAVPASQAQVFVIRRILGHVDLSLGDVFSGEFWTQQLPDAWRLLGAVRLLLRERQPVKNITNADRVTPGTHFGLEQEECAHGWGGVVARPCTVVSRGERTRRRALSRGGCAAPAIADLQSGVGSRKGRTSRARCATRAGAVGKRGDGRLLVADGRIGGRGGTRHVLARGAGSFGPARAALRPRPADLATYLPER
jgi:hypothetical protein